MKIIFFLIVSIIITYSCSPINKQHGYIMEDTVNPSNSLSKLNLKTTTENEVLQTFGSPSIIINDVNNIWIYLVTVKRENIFEDDYVMYQSIMRYEFDDKGQLLSKEFLNREDFTEIAFSKDKTKVFSDEYGLADQIYETFTRGQ